MQNENLLEQSTHFAFGKNWSEYALKIDESRIAQAMEDLKRLTQRTSLEGRSFLDIGCGSGLHALAATRLGASRVMATDIDPESVATARRTLSRFTPDTDWEVQLCSIFDMPPEQFGTFDIVYSWGVLHHTGDMRRAIGLSTKLVAAHGELYLALYKKTLFCGLWRILKRRYSRADPARQERMRKAYLMLRKFAARMSGRDFDAYVRTYRIRRGMDFYHDIHDWLGGYPYESISPPGCRKLLAHYGFELLHQFTGHQWRSLFGLLGSGCDEYAFRRIHAPTQAMVRDAASGT